MNTIITFILERQGVLIIGMSGIFISIQKIKNLNKRVVRKSFNKLKSVKLMNGVNKFRELKKKQPQNKHPPSFSQLNVSKHYK